jgi:hypothetical protein
MNFKITFEITEKELAKALLPGGGNITEIEVSETKQRRRRTTTTPKETTPKPRASSRKKTSQKKEA